MKTKFGAIIVDGRGKINGMVAAKNRAGAYLRTKVTPVNPRSTDQSEVRNRLAGLAQGWRGLTTSQIAAWNAAVSNFAKTDIFGDLKNPSGFNLYCRLNANLLIAGESAISSPPLPGAVESIDSISITADIGAGSMNVTFSPAIPATDKFLLLATPGVSAGRSFSKNLFRVIAVLDNADVSPYDYESDYTAKFGLPAVGQKVFVAMVGINVSTGQKGVPVQASVIVTST